MAKPFQNLAGRRFNRLLVIRPSKNFGPDNRFWTCQCDCGNQKDIRDGNLRQGSTKSCGCLRHEVCSAPEWGGRRIKPDTAFRRVLKEYKQGAKRRGLIWDLTDEQAKALMTSRCYYTGRFPTKKSASLGGEIFLYNGIDRLQNDIGYIWDNCVPCCHEVNMMKHILPCETFLRLCKEVAEFNWKLAKEEMCPRL